MEETPTITTQQTLFTNIPLIVEPTPDLKKIKSEECIELKNIK